MTIKLASINVAVADPQQSKKFYIDALGMTENARRSQPPAFVYLESDGADMTLATPQAAPAGSAGSATIELGFETDDLVALQARLTELGVTGFVPQSMGWGDAIEGRDLDGHRVIVYRFKRE